MNGFIKDDCGCINLDNSLISKFYGFIIVWKSKLRFLTIFYAFYNLNEWFYRIIYGFIFVPLTSVFDDEPNFVDINRFNQNIYDF